MEFVIEKGTAADAGAAAALIREVWEGMERKEWYVPDGEAVLAERMEEGKGLLYRAWEEETGALAAVLFVLLPGRSEENLGRDAGLSDSELTRAAHIESAAILPRYRGNGLQGKMMGRAEEELVRMGYRYLLCTVHPENYFSLNNMLRQGYGVLRTMEKYGGLRRSILCKVAGEGAFRQQSDGGRPANPCLTKYNRVL